MTRPQRGGFSILEVLLSTTILLGCVVVLGQIGSVGHSHATSADELSRAQVVCQARMNEMLAGASPIKSVTAESIPEMPGWVVNITATPSGQSGISVLRVTVGKVLVDTTMMMPTDAGSMGMPDMMDESSFAEESEFGSESLFGTEGVFGMEASATDDSLFGEESMLGDESSLDMTPPPVLGRQFTLVRWVSKKSAKSALTRPTTTPDTESGDALTDPFSDIDISNLLEPDTGAESSPPPEPTLPAPRETQPAPEPKPSGEAKVEVPEPPPEVSEPTPKSSEPSQNPPPLPGTRPPSRSRTSRR